MSTQPWYIFNNDYIYYIYWAPPYYAQAAFGLISSNLLNVNFRFSSDLLQQYIVLRENKNML